MYYLCHRVFGGLIVFGCGSLKIVKILQINNSYSLISQENSYLLFYTRLYFGEQMLKKQKGQPIYFWVTLIFFVLCNLLIYNLAKQCSCGRAVYPYSYKIANLVVLAVEYGSAVLLGTSEELLA